MGFTDTIRNYLGVVSKADLQKIEEQLATKELLLKRTEDELDSAKPITYTSSLAREVKASEDPQGLVVKRVPIKELQLLYLNNQFIFRAVNARADELTTRGYDIDGKDEEGLRRCKDLITKSGGINLFWQLSVNCDVAGDAYLELVPNE